jgi:hypothetical protein
LKLDRKEKVLNKFILATAACTVCGVAFAQVGTTVTEGAKATSQKAQQLGDQAKASVESQPDKAIDKTKAQVHKAKAHHHAKKAKAAAKDAGDSAKDTVK